MDFQSENPRKSSEDESVEDLLLDLESAIKKKGPFQENDEEKWDLQENSANDDDENDQFNEDFILKELEFCENEEEMQELLEIEESKLIFKNDKAFEYLYRKNLKKSLSMMKIIKKLMQNSTKNKSFREIVCENSEMSKKVQLLTLENKNLKELNASFMEKAHKLSLKVKELSDKLEKKRSYLKIFKGSEQTLQNLDFETLLDIEHKIQDSLRNVSNCKTKIIENMKLKDPRNCIICNANEIDCLIKPCNHMFSCHFCVEKLKECPFDRQEIKSFERVFLC